MPLSKTKIPWVWCWGIVPIVILLELYSQWRINGSVPSAEEWRAAGQAVRAEKGEGDLVVISPSWATSGRSYLKDMISVKDFGRFDITQYKSIFEVSVNGADSPELDGLEREEVQRFGRIVVNRYLRTNPAQVIYDFVDQSRDATVSQNRIVRPRLVIDHWFAPRRVIPVALTYDGVELRYRNVPVSGAVIRGYGIVGYRSGRFNEGGPITIQVFVGQARLGEWVVENFGPMEPFEFAVPKGKPADDVRFVIRATDGLAREFGFAADVRKPLEAAQ